MATDDSISDPARPPTPDDDLPPTRKPSTRNGSERTQQALATASREAPHRGAGAQGMRPMIQRLQLAWVDRPYTVVLAAVLAIPGALAVIYGDEVSRALATIAADTVSRGMGAALLAGGVTTIVGIARGSTLAEVIGLSLLAVGCGIYGLGVILGLGFAGAVAGSGFLAVALATVRRVVTLTAVAPKAGNGV
ncbi:MAG TPA: hypothetical protein VGO16_17995 [Pseudonocardiaceae bacterium]|jgi:hypothetical protein|nr:hypothetical protein [Pseudonocardiaceae bacterium]